MSGRYACTAPRAEKMPMTTGLRYRDSGARIDRAEPRKTFSVCEFWSSIAHPRVKSFTGCEK